MCWMWRPCVSEGKPMWKDWLQHVMETCFRLKTCSTASFYGGFVLVDMRSVSPMAVLIAHFQCIGASPFVYFTVGPFMLERFFCFFLFRTWSRRKAFISILRPGHKDSMRRRACYGTKRTMNVTIFWGGGGEEGCWLQLQWLSGPWMLLNSFQLAWLGTDIQTRGGKGLPLCLEIVNR